MFFTGAACATSAGAQRWQVDLAGTSAIYPNAAAVPSVLLASVLEWDHGDGYRRLGGAVSAFEQSRWAAHVRGDLSRLYSPLGAARPWHLELTGGAAASRHANGEGTAVTRAEMRAHWNGRSWGLWAGGQAAVGWTRDSELAFGPSTGMWARFGRWKAVGMWEPFQLRGVWYSEWHGDATASLGRADLTFYGGWRAAPRDIIAGSASWGGASAAIWLTPTIAIVTAAGSYPQDLLQSLTHGHYLTAALRVSNGRRSTWTRPGVERVLYRATHGENVLRFRLPGARRVAIVGDWTRWRPVSLTRGDDGQWVARLRMRRGVYHFNLLVDGTRWTVPEDAVVVDDGFGGKAALLIVP